jgi:transcriptional regulator with XRE-family HTH domain
MTQSDVAERTIYALSTVSAYETATRIPSADFAKRADKLFGTEGQAEDDEGDLTRLQHLVEQVSVRPWFRDRVEVERKATEIREYDSYQIPGLLQTEDYARAVISAGRPDIMRVQSEYLLEMAQRPNITIQVIPNSEGVTCAYGRAFTILTSNNGSSVVYLEDLINAHYVRNRDEVAQFTLKFDHLRASALIDDKSLQLIKG